MKIESACLDLLRLSIDAALKTREEKKEVLRELQTNIEVAKHLIRTSHELNIIDKEKYILLEGALQEISKMATGWLKYIAST